MFYTRRVCYVKIMLARTLAMLCWYPSAQNTFFRRSFCICSCRLVDHWILFILDGGFILSYRCSWLSIPAWKHHCSKLKDIRYHLDGLQMKEHISGVFLLTNISLNETCLTNNSSYRVRRDRSKLLSIHRSVGESIQTWSNQPRFFWVSEKGWLNHFGCTDMYSA